MLFYVDLFLNGSFAVFFLFCNRKKTFFFRSLYHYQNIFQMCFILLCYSKILIFAKKLHCPTHSRSIGIAGTSSKVSYWAKLKTWHFCVVLQVRQLERTVSLRDLSIVEMEGKMREMSAATYDGIFVWKISDFTKKRQDAVAGRAPAMFSPGNHITRWIPD